MSSTILMVIVLVVMWLVVLVPMFVRRHEDDDEQADDRSVGGARVLTRRAAPGRRAGPHRYHPLDGPARRDYQSDDAPGRAAVAASAFSGDRERRRMLRRRRRTLLLLVALTVGGVAGAEVVTGWFWVVQVFGVVLLAGYVGWLRQQVRRERARRHRRAALSSREAVAFPAALPRRGDDRPAAHTAPERHRVAGQRASGRPVGVRGRTAGPTPAREPGAAASPAAAGWQPVPVPTPTYVTKPAAPRVDSIVSLDDDDPALVDIDPIVAPIERRRAANG